MIDFDKKTVLASTLIATAYFAATLAAIAFTSIRWPMICWPPRIGGLEVGVAVLLQGYMYARSDEYQRITRSGRTVEQTVMHVAGCLALFGTILWAFGDMFDWSVLRVPVSCRPQ